jgi:hypothetical protein
MKVNFHSENPSVFLAIFFRGAGIWTRGLIPTRHALYHLNYCPKPIVFLETAGV